MFLDGKLENVVININTFSEYSKLTEIIKKFYDTKVKYLITLLDDELYILE